MAIFAPDETLPSSATLLVSLYSQWKQGMPSQNWRTGNIAFLVMPLFCIQLCLVRILLTSKLAHKNLPTAFSPLVTVVKYVRQQIEERERGMLPNLKCNSNLLPMSLPRQPAKKLIQSNNSSKKSRKMILVLTVAPSPPVSPSLAHFPSSCPPPPASSHSAPCLNPPSPLHPPLPL